MTYSEALDKHMSICIFRLQTGLDHSRYGRLSHLTESSDNEIGSKMTKLDMISTPNGDKSNLLLPYDSVMSQSKILPLYICWFFNFKSYFNTFSFLSENSEQ